MKYALDIVLRLPRDRVVELFDDPENLKHWQPNIVSFEHMHGVPGTPGARSRIVSYFGIKKFEIIQTIISTNLPDEFTATFETEGIWNKLHNRFVHINHERTKWLLISEVRYSGVMGFAASMVPELFRNQTIKHMKQFQLFAEYNN